MPVSYENEMKRRQDAAQRRDRHLKAKMGTVAYWWARWFGTYPPENWRARYGDPPGEPAPRAPFC